MNGALMQDRDHTCPTHSFIDFTCHSFDKQYTARNKSINVFHIFRTPALLITQELLHFIVTEISNCEYLPKPSVGRATYIYV